MRALVAKGANILDASAIRALTKLPWTNISGCKNINPKLEEKVFSGYTAVSQYRRKLMTNLGEPPPKTLNPYPLKSGRCSRGI